MNKSILKMAGLHALGTVLYVALVATFLSYASQLFGEGKEETVLIPIAMLLLFVLSATVTGSLVLGKPVLWYLDGKKKDAVSLFAATLGFLFIFTCIAFVGLAIMPR